MTDIYFPVQKVPVEEVAPGFEHPSGLSHAVVVTKPDGVQRVVQYCSDLYHLVRNEDVIPFLEQTLSKYYKVEVKIKMRSWSQFYVDFILKDKFIKIQDGDLIFPRLRTVNSYDGRVRFSHAAGFYREVCTNGMIAPVGSTQSKLISMHTPKIGQETSHEGLLEMMSAFLAEASNLSEVYFELKEQSVSDAHSRIEEVVENTAFPLKIHEDVLFRYATELAALPEKQHNDWLIYSAFNYQLNHNEDFRAKEMKKEDIDLEVLNYLLKY